MDLLNLASALISRASITPNDAGCQILIREFLAALQFRCESLRFADVDNLWARYGTHGPLFVFAGHTDVVPPGPEEQWTSPPFTPTIREGYLFGRGATDMKAAIAAMMIATRNFLLKNPSFDASIAFLITSDEEGKAINGTKKVIEALEHRKEKIDYCLIGEASSAQQVGDQVRIGRRGSLHGKLRIHGRQGHVAYPERASNPIHLCLSALYELTQIKWDAGNEHFPPTTFQFTNIHSGTGATNVIPGQLEVLFNLRFSTATTVRLIQDRVQSILTHHQLHADLSWELGAEPFLPKQGKLIDATQQAIWELTQQKTRLSTGGGTSDGRFIAPTGAEIIELGVISDSAHAIDECVKISELETLSALYLRILEVIFA